jgi:hypothetical protein
LKAKIITLFDYSMDIFLKLQKVIVDSYTVIFRGGIVLLGLALFALSQHTPDILNYELNAKQVSFEFEELTGRKLSEVECEHLKANIKLCLLAKYQEDTVKKTTSMFMVFYKLLVDAGLILLSVSVYGFISSAHFQRDDL